MNTTTKPDYFYESYQQFKRPFVRDLAFALACPDVITDWQSANRHQNHNTSNNTQNIHVHTPDFWQTQFNNYLPRLQQLDSTTDYQRLTTFLMNRPSPHRLGFHFEGLILFWLLDGYALGLHSYEVIANNVQLISQQGKQQRTLGELDLILLNHENKTIEHWELAIKFYLGSYPFKPINWVGINSKDNLQRKMTHMTEKPFIHDSLEIEGVTLKIDKRYAVIKGRFFVPFDTATNELIKPSWLTEEFPLHTWYTPKQAQIFLIELLGGKIRASKYIEWFTIRPFCMGFHTNKQQYKPNQHRQMNILKESKTNLYVLQLPPFIDSLNSLMTKESVITSKITSNQTSYIIIRP